MVSQLLTAYANNGTLSTTTDTDDTFTSTTGSNWDHQCSGKVATTATGYRHTQHTVSQMALGLTNVQGTYCGGSELYFAWMLADTGTEANGQYSIGPCGTSQFTNITCNSNSKFRLVVDSNKCEWWFDLNGDDTWALQSTYTDTGNIPTLYLAVSLKLTGKSCVWSSVHTPPPTPSSASINPPPIAWVNV